ncbi:MAG: AMP-binding protein [Bacteroidota bacterium]
MKHFIVDESFQIQKSITTFLEDIHADNHYYRVYRYANFYEYLVNLVKALVNDKDVVLIDADFTQQELDNLGYADCVNLEEEILNVVYLTDQKEMVKKIQDSKSRITLFTSGTTGLPKVVHHTIPSLTRMIRVGSNYQENIWGLAYNPTHMAGVQVLLQSLLNLNTLVYIFGKTSNEVALNINLYNITHLSATPTFYRLLVASKDVFPLVEKITLGGEKSDPKLHLDIKLSFPNAKINNIYASTELGSLFVAKGDIFSVPDSIKKHVRVVDEELEIHTSIIPNMEKEEWYKTGDIVEIIDESPLRFKFKNRKTEMINVGGYKVNPNEIEEALRLFPELENARIYGKPNSVLGNIVCMEFVLNKGAKIEVVEIKKRLSEQFQDFKIPRIIKEVVAIEKTRTGKINRK